jgi:hypothetical protein
MNILRIEKAQKKIIDLDAFAAEFADNDHGHYNIEKHRRQSQSQQEIREVHHALLDLKLSRNLGVSC